MLPAAVAFVSAVASAAPEARGVAFEVLAAPASSRSACPASAFAALAAAGFSSLAFRIDRGEGGGIGASGAAGPYDGLVMCAATNAAFVVVTGPLAARAREFVGRVRTGFNPRALSNGEGAGYDSAPAGARVFRSFEVQEDVRSCRSAALRVLAERGFSAVWQDTVSRDRGAVDGARGAVRATFLCSTGFASALVVTAPTPREAAGVSRHLFAAFAGAGP